MEQTRIARESDLTETSKQVLAVRQDIFEIKGKVKKDIASISKYSAASIKEIRDAKGGGESGLLLSVIVRPVASLCNHDELHGTHIR
jgi:hypothetical protein